MLKISRFIEFNERNYETFSLELAHLLFAAAAETEVILKSLCKMIKAEGVNTPAKLKNCFPIIKNRLDEFTHEECSIRRYGLILHPWNNWQGEKYEDPLWWAAYSKVKHYRNNHFHEANLKNTLNAFAALCSTNLYYHYYSFSQQEAPSFSQAILNLGDEPELISFKENYYTNLGYGPTRHNA